jgi:hypothetical protein
LSSEHLREVVDLFFPKARQRRSLRPRRRKAESQPPQFPEKIKWLWIVVEGEDGRLAAVELPQPEGIAIETNREEIEQAEWNDRPWYERDHFLPAFKPWKVQVTIEGYDADKHPKDDPRPKPYFTIFVKDPKQGKR